MKYRSSLIAVFLLLIVSASAAADAPFFAARERGVKDLYIVVLAENVAQHPRGPKVSLPAVAEVAKDLGARYGGKVEMIFEHVVQGFTIRMPEARARHMAGDSAVEKVVQDAYLEAPLSAPVDDCYYGPGAALYSVNTRALPLFSPQSLSCSNPDPQSGTTCLDNWGIDRIDQSSVTRNNNYSFAHRGLGVHVYVLDTGIRASHREFYDRLTQSRVSTGVNATVPVGDPARNDTSDCYGHGTHVAGILAGRTYGVAKDAILHPVRILRCNNDSQVSWWTGGLDWIAANHNPSNEGTAIVSWSGGNNNTWVTSPYEPYLSLRNAVHNLAAIPTLLLVQSAGNQSKDFPNVPKDACTWSFGDESVYASDPAKYAAVSRIFVVGGSDENDERWTRRMGDPGFTNYCGSDCGSNVGACIDIFAPAAHVVSASYRDNAGFCRLSGTSMAAPHAAGVAALYLQRNRQASAATVKSTLLQYGQAGALQSNSADPNYIGSSSPNLLLRTSLPAVTCGVDRTFSTPVNTTLTFYASTLRGSGCAVGDFAYSGFDTQYGSISIGGIAPEDIVYYYTPPAGFIGTDSFTYTVYDFPGQVKAMGLVKVTVY